MPTATPSRTVAPELHDVVRYLEGRYAPDTAQDWDQIGLATGDLGQSVRSVLLSVDPLPAVLDEAVTGDHDLVVTHHPLLFHGVHAATSDSVKGRALRTLIKNDIALFSAHTNADSAVGGVNDALADTLGIGQRQPLVPVPDALLARIGVNVPVPSAERVLTALTDVGAGRTDSYDQCAYWTDGTGQFRPLPGAEPARGAVGQVQRTQEHRLDVLLPRTLVPAAVQAIHAHHPYEVPAYDVVDLVPEPGSRGMGRYGPLREATTLTDLADRLARALPGTTHGVRVAGDPQTPVEAAACCGGSGDSLLDTVRTLPVQAYVTSDLRHHPATDHLAAGGCALLDIAHWAGEWLWLRAAADELRREAADRGWTLDVAVSDINTDAWTFHVPAGAA